MTGSGKSTHRSDLLVLDSLEGFLQSIRLEGFTEENYNPGFLEYASLDFTVRIDAFCAPYYSEFNSMFKGFFRGLENSEELENYLRSIPKNSYLKIVLSDLMVKWISVNIEKEFNSIDESEKQDFFLKIMYICLFLLNLGSIDISSERKVITEFNRKEFLTIRDLEFICSRVARELNSMKTKEFWELKDSCEANFDYFNSDEMIKILEILFYKKLNFSKNKEKISYYSMGPILFRAEASNDNLSDLSWESIFNLYEGLLK